jgi:phage major head subunit gpT-like protein
MGDIYSEPTQVLNKQNLAQFLVDNSIIFDDRFKVAPMKYQELYGTAKKSSKLLMDITEFLEDGPVRRELTGDKISDLFKAGLYIVKLKKYYKKYNIDIYEFDQLIDKFRAKIGQLAQKSKKWIQLEFVKLVLNAQINNCIDGTPFFNAAHPIGELGTFSNVCDLAFNGTNLGKAIAQWDAWKTPDGEYLDTDPDTLVVASDIYQTAVELMDSPLKPGGNKNDVNIYYKAYKLVKMKELPAGYWMLLNTTDDFKPFNPVIFYGNIVKGIMLTQDQDIRHIISDMNFSYCLDGATGGFYGFPETALLSTGGNGSSSSS